MRKISCIIAFLLSMTILVSGWGTSPVLAQEDRANEGSLYVDEAEGEEETAQLDGGLNYATIEINSIQELANALGSDSVTILSTTELSLNKNIVCSDVKSISIMSGSYTIDFKGFMIEGNFTMTIVSGDVTCKDSSEAKTGGTNIPDDIPYYYGTFRLSGGNLTILSGVYEGFGAAVAVDQGTFTMKGGSIRYADVNNSAVVYTDNDGDEVGIINIMGGSIISDDMYSPAVRVISGGSLNMTGGYLSAKQDAIFLNSGSMTSISGGRCLGGGAGVGINNGTLSISGGSIEGEYAGLAVSSDDDMQKNITLTGGIFKSTSTTRGGGVITTSRLMETTCSVSALIGKDYMFIPSTITEEFWDFGDGSTDTFLCSHTESTVIVASNIGVEGFVNRLYAKALERIPDPTGFADWVSKLKAKNISGAGAAFGFFFSPEITNRKLSDKDFVTLLYTVFFNRTPDATGLSYWLSALETGASRKYVFAGFANSQEWKTLCGTYGIEPGSYTSDEARDQNIKVTAFVQRLYTLCLNRKADVLGLNDWTAALNSKKQDGAHVAYGFFFSPEFKNRNLSNESYVEVLYQVLLGRASDSKGKADWVAQLKAGKDRMEVFSGFVHSKEFDAICVEYGITRGTI